MSEDVKPYGNEGEDGMRAAQELRALLESAGYTQVAAAAELDVSERVMREYCSGRGPVPRVVLYAMRWIVDHKPNAQRWLQVHWKKADLVVTRGDKFKIEELGNELRILVNGKEAMRGTLADLERRGLVSMHTSYSGDRFHLAAPETAAPARVAKELPEGSIYLLTPAGKRIAEHTLATSNPAVARNYLKRMTAEGAPYETWLATRTAL